MTIERYAVNVFTCFYDLQVDLSWLGFKHTTFYMPGKRWNWLRHPHSTIQSMIPDALSNRQKSDDMLGHCYTFKKYFLCWLRVTCWYNIGTVLEKSKLKDDHFAPRNRYLNTVPQAPPPPKNCWYSNTRTEYLRLCNLEWFVKWWETRRYVGNKNFQKKSKSGLTLISILWHYFKLFDS